MIRTVVRRLHLAVAVVAGGPILVMAATGVVLSLEDAATGLAERRLFATPPPGAERLTVGMLSESARSATAPDAPFEAVSIRYEADRRAAARLRSLRGRLLFVNAYTGEALGPGSPSVAEFFEGVRRLHRWFAVPDGSARRGRAVTGAANLAFLFLLATGPMLWLPRPINRRTLVMSMRPLRGARGLAWAVNWHRVAGFWAVAPLMMIATSAVVLSYPAVGDRVLPTAGTVLPLGSVAPPANLDADLTATVDADLDLALAAAERAVPRWRSIVLHVPSGETREVAVDVRTGGEGQPQRAVALVVDGRTGAVVGWETFGDASPGRKAQQFFRYAHTGAYWGVPGRVVVAAGSLAAMCLVWTGFTMARRALARWRSEARFRRAGRPEPEPGP